MKKFTDEEIAAWHAERQDVKPPLWWITLAVKP